MWLAVASQDIARAAALAQQRQDAEFHAALPGGPGDFDPSAVVDLDAEESRCPACLASVPGGAIRCPSCRLRFA